MNAQPDIEWHYALASVDGPMPDSLWQRLEPKIARAMEVGGPWNADDIRAEIEHGEAWMLVVHDPDDPAYVVAGVVCMPEQWRDRKVLTVIAAAGVDFEGWIADVQKALEFHVKRTKCDAIRAICRPGMAKWLQNIGYRQVAHIMEYRPDG